MLDFSDQQEQSTGGCIPENSICLFELRLKPSDKPETRTDNPLILRTKKNVFYINCEFECISGAYEGRKIYEMIPLPVKMQTAPVTKQGNPDYDDGQVKWCNGGGGRIRAIIEAQFNVDPKDKSEQAMKARSIASIDKLHSMRIPIKVGYKKIQDGDKYVNNRIKSIITKNREHYDEVMNGGQVITDEPIPTITTAQQYVARQGDNDPNRFNGQGDFSAPAFPSEASGMDQVPF